MRNAEVNFVSVQGLTVEYLGEDVYKITGTVNKVKIDCEVFARDMGEIKFKGKGCRTLKEMHREGVFFQLIRDYWAWINNKRYLEGKIEVIESLDLVN